MDYGMCKFYGDVVACYQEFIKNCTGNDVLTEELYQGLASLRARGEQCPGMRDGSCFREELHNCEEKAPFYMKYQIGHSDEGKKTYCADFKTKLPEAKECVSELTTSCVTFHHHKYVNASIAKLESYEKLCDDYWQNM